MEEHRWNGSIENEQGSLMNQNFYTGSQELEDMTCWKTNLMLKDQVDRVKERGEQFKRRTSFEDSILNEHLQEMIKILRSTDLRLLPIEIPKGDRHFKSIKQSKEAEILKVNRYLTEEQKWDCSEALFRNHQNFSIFFRMATVFDQNKDELVYLLAKILYFSSVELDLSVKHNTSQNSILDMMENHKLQLANYILNQQYIKMINPIFFSNVNQQPLMRIINSWFYHVICIKKGLYGEEMSEEAETRFFEENLFQ